MRRHVRSAADAWEQVLAPMPSLGSPLWLLRRRSGGPHPASGARPVLQDHADVFPRQALCCAACRAPITDAAERIAVDGAHAHTFTNPHGLEFNIGCFRSAPGCRVEDEGSGHWTWFAGYDWHIAACRRCATHLGWMYRNASDRFYGLILERLVGAPD